VKKEEAGRENGKGKKWIEGWKEGSKKEVWERDRQGD